MVRATLGRRSGPMTISATTPMTRSSEKPMSNMVQSKVQDSSRKACCSLHRGSRTSALLLVLDFGVDGAATFLAFLADLGRIFLHAFLQSLHRATQVAADVAQLLGAENQQHDDQNDQPMPDAKATHGVSPVGLTALGGFAAAEYVNVKMEHFLAAAASGVDQRLEAGVESLFFRQARCQQQHPAELRLVRGRAVGQRRDVQLRNDQEVDARKRMDVVKRQHLVVFVDLAARDVAGDDLAEDAVSHFDSLFQPARTGPRGARVRSARRQASAPCAPAAPGYETTNRRLRR